MAWLCELCLSKEVKHSCPLSTEDGYSGPWRDVHGLNSSQYKKIALETASCSWSPFLQGSLFLFLSSPPWGGLGWGGVGGGRGWMRSL